MLRHPTIPRKPCDKRETYTTSTPLDYLMSKSEGAFVTFEWLIENQTNVQLIDVREPWEYEQIGHIPGAINIPFDRIRIRGSHDTGMLPGASQFTRELRSAGVDPSEPIVAYDDELSVFAARFVVTCLMYNHTPSYVLDGDYSAWARGFETTLEPFEPDNDLFPIRIAQDRPLVDVEDVKRAAEDDDAVLVDTRTKQEFDDGHIENAVHFDWRELVDRDSRQLKPDDTIREILESRGITPDKRVVLYCNTARRISHTYLVLLHFKYPDVRLFEGSLLEWNEQELDLTSTTEGATGD